MTRASAESRPALAMIEKRPGPKPNQDMPDIIDLLLATGCRIGEVLAIRWTDIDLSATPPTVSISGTIKTETGKSTYRKPKPKSDSSKRTITLPPFAVDVLMRRRVEQRPNHYNAVFATRNGTWHQVGNIERRWRTIRADTGWVCGSLGLPRHLGPRYRAIPLREPHPGNPPDQRLSRYDRVPQDLSGAPSRDGSVMRHTLCRPDLSVAFEDSKVLGRGSAR